MEGMTAVKVAARVRPLVKREKNEGARICMTARPTDNAIDINNSTTFTFDMVFGVDSTQEEVYEAAAAPLLDKLFHGYNATIFAYGQTGSGKTHSMGTEDFHTDTLVSVSEQGIIPRVAAAIFARARQLPSANVAVSVSMLEIYEEKVHDLLGAGANLAIREAGGQVFVQDLREVQVHSPQDTMRQLEEGSNGRSKGATAMNARSSRSHAVFTISLAIAHNDDCDEAGANLRSKLHLVDLAGSERPQEDPGHRRNAARRASRSTKGSPSSATSSTPSSRTPSTSPTATPSSPASSRTPSAETPPPSCSSASLPPTPTPSRA